MGDKHLTLSNYEISEKVDILSSFFDYSGRFGYAIARNYRLLTGSLYDFNNIKYNLLQQYGRDDLDSNGQPIGTKSLSPGDDNYDTVLNKLYELSLIEHDVEIFAITYDDLPDDLSARQIIELQWMIE